MLIAVGAEVQREIIAFLSTPGTFRASGPVERIDTHLSVVWLAGDQAYKLKREVRFDYVDFSTSEQRRIACEAEVRVNRRTAPGLYRGVWPVTREADGSLALNGGGTPLDWLVEMTRFDQDTLFDRLAERQRLDLSLMEELADVLVRFHSDAERIYDRGGQPGIERVIEGNARGFSEPAASVLDRAACERLTADARAALSRCHDLLETRRRRGAVRRCHGDLHLRNICLVDGRPTLFDAIEFNDDISCIDVLYDLAFVLMDLWRRGLRRHANAVFNVYLAQTGDLDGLAAMPLLLSCRAAVRAKTGVSAARVQPEARQRETLEEAARQYLALARTLLFPAPPVLIAVGGFSGSGKSTLARGLAPGVGAAPGALVLRSDLVRKELLGVPALTPLGPEGYAPSVSRQVYRTIAERALRILRAGHAVVADAVYARAEDREQIASIARESRVPFVGLWLEGPPHVLAKRLRERGLDVSDATPEVLAQQRLAPPGRFDWHTLDASTDAGSVLGRAETLCGEVLQQSHAV